MLVSLVVILDSVPEATSLLIQRKMYKLRKMYNFTFFAVYTFFVGTADEKCKTVLHLSYRILGNFDEKCIFFSVATKNVKIMNYS